MNIYSSGNKVEGVIMDRLENGNICTQAWANGRYISIKQTIMTKEGVRESDGEEMAQRLIALVDRALKEMDSQDRDN